VTTLAALGSPGVAAGMTRDGAPDAEVFRADGAPGLRPTRRPGDSVLMDHRRAHQAAGMRAAIAPAGAQWLSWPPDSPDGSPIEPGWSKLKAAWRTAKARPREAWEHALAPALAPITASEAHSGFRPCGDALP
jgi:transposase